MENTNLDLDNWSEQQQYIERVKNLLAERYDHPPLVYTKTYGCQQNVADSEKLAGMLISMGYVLTDRPDMAELILFNTCAVREHAEDRVFGNIGALKNQKRRNPNLIIAVCGCMTQQEGAANKIKESYPFVDLVMGTHTMPVFPKLLHEALTEGHRVFDNGEWGGLSAENLPVLRENTIRAYVPVMNGCDNFCSYCIVPYVRGREKSRESKSIVAEIQTLINEGYKEITLLGQNVNSYGKGLSETVDFAALLQKINALPGDFRIRFMTSHPKDATRRLIDVMAECEKVCAHLHLPVQSGSNRILQAMNRRYTREAYLDLIGYAKEKIPRLSLTSDIIVGFPGETEEDFSDTLDLITHVRYTSLYTFLYSKRSGTAAAALPDDTTDDEKKSRFSRLLAAQDEIGLMAHQGLVGQTLRVLADGPGKLGEGYLAGRSEGNVIVECKAPKEWAGRFFDVKIDRAFKWAVAGEVLDSET